MYCIPETSLKYPSVLVCIDCWINKISLPCPEDVGTLPNLVKYCVDCFSLLFSVIVVLVHLRLHQSPPDLWIPQRDYFLRTIIGIRSSHVSRGIVYWFQGHQLLSGRDRVSISEQRLDYLWEGVDFKTACRLLEESIWTSRVSRGGKDPVFI